jgi:hypothetical protein
MTINNVKALTPGQPDHDCIHLTVLVVGTAAKTH